MVTTTRQTAEERRAAVLESARAHFSAHGYKGASTEAIARDAGISQPYLFRLFGTKKELYLASAGACMGRVLTEFQDAAGGLHGEEALHAIGARYKELIADRQMLNAQLQMYAAACDDAEIRAAVRARYRDLVEYVERVSGASPDVVAQFFATGMLMNVLVALGAPESGELWAGRMIEGCMGEKDV